MRALSGGAPAGQRKVQMGDKEGAAAMLKAALDVGTDDPRVLSVVHSQLGNCLSFVGLFDTSIVHHEADLELCEQLEDKEGAAKAWANLGAPAPPPRPRPPRR